MDGLILAGDVGGTKTHLGLFKHSAGNLELDARASLSRPPSSTASRPHARIFLAPGATVNAACFGVPGPIIDGRATRHQRPVATLERIRSRAH